MPRGEGQKNISQKVVDAVIAVKIINPGYGAKGILDAIRTNRKAYHINGDRVPGEGKVYDILKKNKDKINNRRKELKKVSNEIDGPWFVGSCLKYNIPPAMIPILIELQQVERELSEGLHDGVELTIRQCRWIAFLYQSVTASEILKNRWEPLQLKGRVSIMADMYAKREQIAEVMRQPIDTSDLDLLFSTDVDFLKLWLKTFEPEQYEKDKEASSTFKPLSREVLISILGMNEISQENTDLFNEGLKNQYLAQTEPREAGKFDKLLLKQHPELQPMIDSWFKWIEVNGKEDILNG